MYVQLMRHKCEQLTQATYLVPPPDPKLMALHSLGDGSVAEAILESTGHGLEVSHASSSCRPLSLSLRGPSDESTGLGGRVAASSAPSLLLVEGNLATTAARRVCLGLPLSERLRSLSLWLHKQIHEF